MHSDSTKEVQLEWCSPHPFIFYIVWREMKESSLAILKEIQRDEGRRGSKIEITKDLIFSGYLWIKRF
jgi:hypothetical protein